MDDNWFVHFLRFVFVSILINIAFLLYVPGLIWLAFMLRMTGRRARDLLLCMLPIVGVVVLFQTIWRYSAKSVYWSVRDDLESKTLFYGGGRVLLPAVVPSTPPAPSQAAVGVGV